MHRTLFLKCTLLVAIISVVIAAFCNVYLVQSYMWHGLGLYKTYNPGIAFGLHMGRLQSVLILIALSWISILAYKNIRTQYEAMAYALICGGGLANVLDRLPDGLVTDMFKVGTFPIFNVADVCINIGVAWLLLQMLTAKKTSH